jgi:hypothetical protein
MTQILRRRAATRTNSKVCTLTVANPEPIRVSPKITRDEYANEEGWEAKIQSRGINEVMPALFRMANWLGQREYLSGSTTKRSSLHVMDPDGHG